MWRWIRDLRSYVAVLATTTLVFLGMWLWCSWGKDELPAPPAADQAQVNGSSAPPAPTPGEQAIADAVGKIASALNQQSSPANVVRQHHQLEVDVLEKEIEKADHLLTLRDRWLMLTGQDEIGYLQNQRIGELEQTIELLEQADDGEERQYRSDVRARLGRIEANQASHNKLLQQLPRKVQRGIDNKIDSLESQIGELNGNLEGIQAAVAEVVANVLQDKIAEIPQAATADELASALEPTLQQLAERLKEVCCDATGRDVNVTCKCVSSDTAEEPEPEEPGNDNNNAQPQPEAVATEPKSTKVEVAPGCFVEIRVFVL